MSPNKQVIETYYANFSKLDRPGVLSCLTDDVEWIEWDDGFPNSGVPMRGKAAFSQNINDPPGGGSLRIEIKRMTEENNVVIAECVVHVPIKDGDPIMIQAWDIFELENGKIKRLSSSTTRMKKSA